MTRFFNGTSANERFIFQNVYPGVTDDLNANGNGGNDFIQGFTQNDYLNGGDGNDTLIGGSGNDVLTGGLGADSMQGGTGDDTYYVAHPGDVVVENPNEGIDTIFATGLMVMPDNVENLTLYNLDLNLSYGSQGNSLNNVMRTLSDTQVAFGGGAGDDTIYGGNGRYADVLVGETGNDVLYGNAGNDSLYGDEGNDILDGGTGNDSMEGGLGNDTYYVDSTGDVVTENLNEGTDTVFSTISYTLGDNVENLTLTGTSNINGTGNTLNNFITGNSGNNTLYGGYGSDTLSGGDGDDHIDGGGASFYDTSNDSLSGGNGNDYLLGGYGADTLNGDDGNDELNGFDGNDVLNGGAGNDSLIGGAGNDTYYVDSAGDVVTENLNKGTDTVFSANGYALGANLENLTLLGSTRMNGYGNELNNIITGNDARNYLDGGAGNDTINGAGGDDSIIGKAGNDSLLGGNGNDTLEGYGGSMNEVDTLFGGAGSDIFSLGFDYASVFFYTGNGNSYAIITDFSRSQGDKIDIVGTSSSFSNYNFTQSGNDTQIIYQNDLIAVVQNTIASSFIQSDFI